MPSNISNEGKKLIQEAVKTLKEDKKLLVEKGKRFDREYQAALKAKEDHADRVDAMDAKIAELEGDVL